MKDDCCNKDDCDEASYGGCGGDSGEDAHDCPTCNSRCLRGSSVAGNPEKAEFTVSTVNFDIGIDPPTSCASLEGDKVLTYDADADNWAGGPFMLSLECSTSCGESNGSLAVDCDDASSPWTWDGSKWSGGGDGDNGLGCLQSGQVDSTTWACHFGAATIEGNVDMHGGTTATLVSDASYGELTLNSDGSFSYDATENPLSMLSDSFIYQIDGDAGYFANVNIYPQPRVFGVGQSGSNILSTECGGPPPIGPPGPFPPIPATGCDCDGFSFPGAYMFVPGRCDGSAAVYMTVNGTGVSGCLDGSDQGPTVWSGMGVGCVPIALPFVSGDETTAYYASDLTDTSKSICGGDTWIQTNLFTPSVTVSCFGNSVVTTWGSTSVTAACSASTISRDEGPGGYVVGVYTYDACDTGDAGCADCVAAKHGGQVPPCWPDWGQTYEIGIGGNQYSYASSGSVVPL